MKPTSNQRCCFCENSIGDRGIWCQYGEGLLPKGTPEVRGTDTCDFIPGTPNTWLNSEIGKVIKLVIAWLAVSLLLGLIASATLLFADLLTQAFPR